VGDSTDTNPNYFMSTWTMLFATIWMASN